MFRTCFIFVLILGLIIVARIRHPYNPLKALSHTFLDSPDGQVTLTRSSVLALSGWSNTQFSYWARRVEGISVLSEYDERLRSVVIALERRLKGEPRADSDNATTATTGKGLDNIIDEVKKRTGKSQFLRGKHSSLDPFGSVNKFDLKLSAMSENEGARCSGDSWRTAAPVYNTSFQALAYFHEAPQGVAGRLDGQEWQGERKQGKRKRRGSGARDGVEERTDLGRRIQEDDTAPESSDPLSGSAGNASVTDSRRSSTSCIDADSPLISLATSDSRARTNASRRKRKETTSTPPPLMPSPRRRRSTIDSGNPPQKDITDSSSTRKRRRTR
jgi:hypothetical protein